MLKTYLLIALRKIAREKSYVFINVGSLALGIASFLIIALYLRNEMTYDLHHVNHDRIYRISTHFTKADGHEDNFAISQNGLGPMLVGEYPQLGTQVRFFKAAQGALQYKDIVGRWDNVYLADPSVFEVFTHKIIHGDKSTAFRTPYSIAINHTLAKYYFGNENPIGKTISGAGYSFAVTLVFEDLPENTHLKYSALFPMSLVEVFDPNFTKNYENTLWGVGLFTYLMVPKEFAPEDFKRISAEFAAHHMADRQTQLRTKFAAELQPLADIHFGDKLQGDLLTGNIFYVYGFAGVAIFILLVACINYMNLATARATKRAKEVGIRKVIGASQTQLVLQFLGESAAYVVIALAIAIVMVHLALSLTPIGSLMGKGQLLSALGESGVWFGIAGLAVAVVLMSGLYPAFYLSAISPLAALTQIKQSWRTGFSMRQVLVFLQLSISIGVIACTLLMSDQMRYIHEKPLGFDKQNRLIVKLFGYDVVKNIKTIKNELSRLPNVVNVVTIGVVPGTGSGVNVVRADNNAGVFEPMNTDRIAVGLNFVEAMNVQLTEGRGFSESIATDAREAVIVNESFVKQAGWSNALGKRFQLGAYGFSRVVGVVKDFHYSSLHNAIGPLLITPISESFDSVPEQQRPLVTSSLIVTMSGEKMGATIDSVRGVIANFDPGFQFEPVFLEDRLEDLYRSESNLMKLSGIFAGICIFISVIGLFSLTAFTTEQRTKEIGVRQVLGASIAQIVAMLSKHLLLIALIAAIPASILSYYIIDKWIQRFVYHAEIGFLTFVLSTLIVTLIALATVVLQSARTMNADPVDALRFE